MGDDQIPVVQDVVADEAVQEIRNLPDELRRFIFQLLQGPGEAVGDVDVLAPQLADQLHVVVSGNGQGGPRLDHAHHQPEDFGSLRTAVYQVAEEDRPPLLRRMDHVSSDILRDLVAELIQQL